MDNNPLKQYFRRPAVYIKLPSDGLCYPTGALDMPDNRELPVYPMTAIDEITTRTPDALFNGTAITELIKSCIPSIKDPWSVPNVDLDAILIAIKTASSPSGEMDIETVCPNCADISTYKVNLSAMLTSISSPDFTKELEVGDLSIKLKPLSFREINKASIDQFEFQRSIEQVNNIEDEDQRNNIMQHALESITALTMDLVAGSVDYIKTPSVIVDEKDFILDFLRNCDRNLYFTIRDYSAELRKASEIKPMAIKCTACSHDFEQTVTLNPTDFFE